ncbi:MAG: hypothetical protein J0I21_01170 [Alphaproteobacteria bacterium]|nr:hypothetical protein [Alphaproteobacteria bacterium]
MMHRLLPVLAALLLAAPALAEEPADLREFRVGEPVEALPTSGYIDLACADAPATKLAIWGEYEKCPRNALGLHAVSFRYDPATNPLARLNDSYEGTRVAGQPALIALLIGDDKRLDGIHIQTDPHTRLYLRKKAFLFGLQARHHYGDDGWTCHDKPPGAGEEPVGGVYVNEHCEKTTATRHLIVERHLYAHPDQPLTNFVGESDVLILLPKELLAK